VRRQLLVVSLKGGVGKTTITVGLAQALSRRGFKVGLLDLDYRSPTAPLLLAPEGVAPLGRTEDDALVPPCVKGIYLFSMGMIWPPDKAVMVEDDLAVEDVRQLLTPGVIAWPEGLDFLCVDSPPSSSGIVTTALAMPHLTGAIVVTHPSSLSRAALLRTLDLLAEKQVPVYALVSNQGYTVTGEPRFDLTDAAIQEVASAYHIPLFWAIPHDSNLAQYFVALANRFLATEPVLLPAPEEPVGSQWEQIMAATRKLTQVFGKSSAKLKT